MKIMIFLHGTIIMHKSAEGKTREEIVKQVKNAYSFRSLMVYYFNKVKRFFLRCFVNKEILLKAPWDSIRDFSSYIPIGGAVEKLKKWANHGAAIYYLSALTEDKRARSDEVVGEEGIKFDQVILDRWGFPKGEIYHRQRGETYAQIAERVMPDILIEDDCESIGGKNEITITHINEDKKRKIKSIPVKEFGGIDHLSDNVLELK